MTSGTGFVLKIFQKENKKFTWELKKPSAKTPFLKTGHQFPSGYAAENSFYKSLGYLLQCSLEGNIHVEKDYLPADSDT